MGFNYTLATLKTGLETSLETGGTPAVHLNEQKRIIDGFYELIADFHSHLVLFLDSLHPRL